MRQLLFIWLLVITSSLMANDLRDGFQNPPQQARPRVWWHWMNGNITRDGLNKDIEWMNRVGIGGIHCFDAAFWGKSIVEKRLTYMSPEWQDHFRFAVSMADSLGMEVAIASCPGWSNTGGPWVKPEQAMKRLVWSETRVKGGKQAHIVLPEPNKDDRWYADIRVLAVKANPADKTMEELGASFSAADTLQSSYWIQYQFKRPVTIKALSIKDGNYRSIWAAQSAPVTKWLEVSDDGTTFRRICGIPHGSVGWQTIDIEPTQAKFFRITFDKKPGITPQLKLYTTSRINHAEEKAGFASPSDMMEFITPSYPDEAIPTTGVIDVTSMVDEQSVLTWKAPKGEWKIYRFGYTLTGKENHPASPEATGLEVSKIDKEAFTRFLEYYLNSYEKATGGLMGSRGIHYLLIDSYEAGWETWCAHMPQEFERRRGYSLLPWLPVLTGEIIGSAQQSEEFLFDWRTTIGELIEECMYQNAAEIAHRHGLETYFESHENGRLYLADGMNVKSQADIPMAAMWTIPKGAKADNSSAAMAESDIRESASVAHLYGKRWVATESMTANGMTGGAYSYYPGNLKETADLEMSCGMNRFVIHESAHQPLDDKKPGLGLMIYGQWFNRHETWAEMAKAWTDYLARSSFMLQQGKNVADVLYYYGEDDVITSLFAHEHPAIPPGYNFDYLNKDALLDLISYDGQHFVTPSGSQYSLMVLSKCCHHMSDAVLDKLEALRQQGAPIIDEKKQPMDIALRTITPDIKTEDMSALRYVHRTTADSEIYWLNNRAEQQRQCHVAFRVSGLKPTLWNPETGDILDVSYEISNGHTLVFLDMMPGDAFFIVFNGKADVLRQTVPDKQETLLKQIDNPWSVSFDEQWGGPASTVFPKLISYTESDDDGIKYYSGTAVYRNSFTVSRAEFEQGHILIDLGEVGCMAQVKVNGKEVGTLWKSPYRADITDVLNIGNNTLEIKVANQWVNRIIGDLQPDCAKKYTYTPCDFYEANSPLLRAGLMGPVTLKQILTTK